MSEPFYPPSASSSSSSHKRAYDAIGPETESGHQGRSRMDSPTRSSSSTEASRERNKRPRNDSDSSYTSEVDELLHSTADSASSSSSSSQSSYHSALSTLPPAASPTLLDEANEDMLVDPVEPESQTRPASPAANHALSFEELLFIPPWQRSPAVSQNSRAEDIARSLERANAFDREIAPLRSSPAAPPTSSSRGPGPLPSFRSLPELENAFDHPHAPNDDLTSRDGGFSAFEPSWLFERSHDTSMLRHRRAGAAPSSSEAVPGIGQRVSFDTRILRPADTTIRVRPAVDQPLHPHAGPAIERSPSGWWRRVGETSTSRRSANPFPAVSPPLAEPTADAHVNRRLGQWRSAFGPGNEPATTREVRPSDEPPFSAYGYSPNPFDLASYAPVNRGRDAIGHPSTRSPRNTPSFPQRRFSDGLEARTMGSPGSVPRATPQSVPPVQHRPSPRLSSMAVRNERSVYNEPRIIAQEREAADFERTLRDVEIHRRRVAEFLAEPLPPFPPYGTPSPRAAPATAPTTVTSSYSTLRHALDDSAAAEAVHRALTPAREPALPPSIRDASTLARITRDLEDATRADDYYVDFSDWGADNSDGPRSFSPPSRRRGPYRMRTADEMLSLGSNPVRPSRPDTPPQPRHPAFEAPPDAPPSYLEYNSRARAIGLSGLRHRARPRSPSPVRPPERVEEPVFPNIWFPPLTGADALDWHWPREYPYTGGGSSYYPTRTAADDAMLQSFTERAVPPRRASPERAAPRPIEDSARPPRSVNINLDAFRDGPFRATLARSVALQHRVAPDRPEPTTMRPERREVPQSSALVAPLPPAIVEYSDDWFRPDPPAEEDMPSEATFGTSDTPADLPDEHIDAWVYETIQRRVRQLQEHDDLRAEPGASRARSPQVSETHRARPPPQAASPVFRPVQPRTAPSVSSMHPLYPMPRVTDTRSSAVRDDGDRRLRHRTLLEREHASGPAWVPSDDAATRATARMDRMQRQREIVQRMMARRQEGPGAASSSTASARNESQTERTGGQPSAEGVGVGLPLPTVTWARRYARPAGREGRPEDRAAPLNGRFARRGGFGQHYPPDMVWVDVPPGRHSSFMRRRNFGDYVRDEDFDVSYEGLLSLSSLLGDAKPRGTPDYIISSLPRGTYREWSRPGATEERCPICLDDYQPDDACLRICGCSHWFHEGCLQQWLKGAHTCPVCRGRVSKPRTEEPPAPVAGPSGSNNRDPDDDSDGDERDEVRRMAGRWNPFLPPWRHD